jgi:SLOG in TRPM, prokaryote
VQVIEFGGGHSARVARPRQFADVDAAVRELGLHRGRRVLVVVGGASGLDERSKERLRTLFSRILVPVAMSWNATVVDGGVDSGVMQLLGQALMTDGASFPLVGVAVEKNVIVPGDASEPGARRALERHHTHFVLVPGSSWGDESPWLARVATEIAAGAPSVTVLVNGGEIAFQDVANSVAAGRPVLVIKGTGRTADQIAAALDGDRTDTQAAHLAGSPLVTAVSWPAGDAVRATLEKLAAGNAPPAAIPLTTWIPT